MNLTKIKYYAPYKILGAIIGIAILLTDNSISRDLKGLMQQDTWFIFGTLFIALSVIWLQSAYRISRRSYKKIKLLENNLETYQRNKLSLFKSYNHNVIDSIDYVNIKEVKLVQTLSHKVASRGSVEIYHIAGGVDKLLVISNLPINEAKETLELLKKIIESKNKNLTQLNIAEGAMLAENREEAAYLKENGFDSKATTIKKFLRAAVIGVICFVILMIFIFGLALHT